MLLAAVAVGSLVPVAPALAAEERRIEYNIEAGDLGEALKIVSRLSGKEIIFNSEAVLGKTAPRLHGPFSADDAVHVLLEGSDLVAQYRKDVIIIRGRSTPSGDLTDRSADVTDIVVTGSNIRGVVPAGSPSITVDRADIDRSGYGTTQQILQALPQVFGGGPNAATFGISNVNDSAYGEYQASTVNLRGLGASSTLALVNGHRVPLGGYGTFADISLIPTSAIERIEILTDGASAIYGSDAVAGVVNLKLREHFEGAESRFRFGSADGDFNEIQVGQLLGHSWSTGHALLAYEYFHQGNLPASDRPYATEDLRRFGGKDYRGGYSAPGTIYAGGRPYAIPTGQDGRNLDPPDLIADQINRGDSRAGSDLLPDQTRHNVFAMAEQEIGPSLRIRAEGLYARRNFLTHARKDQNSRITVPASNPFYVDPLGTGLPVQVQYDFSNDLGPYSRKGHSESIYGTLEADLRLGTWNASVTGTHGQQSDRDLTFNIRNTYRLAQALADNDPNTAFNIFGPGGNNNPATIDKINGSYTFAARYRFSNVVGKVDGPAFTLPAGKVRLSLGAEYRRETISSTLIQDTTTAAPVSRSYFQVPGPRTMEGFFGEAFIPVFGPDNGLPGLRRLDISLALRREHYNTFGTTTNPKAGLAWEPVSGLQFRASYGRSFRTPSFINQDQSPSTRFYQPIALPDPSSPRGQSNVLVVIGNDPNLGPEKARTWTLGLDLKPQFARGFAFSLNYFNVVYRDRIVDPSGNLVNFLSQQSVYQPLLNENPDPALVAQIYSRPEFANPDGISASSIDAIANAQVQNLSSVKVSGIDFDLSKSLPAFRGKLELGISGSYLFEISQAITPSAPSLDFVSTIGFPVDLKFRARALWQSDHWSAAMFANFVNHYTNTLTSKPTNIRSQITIDASISYSIPTTKSIFSGVAFQLSATNLFDRDPPYAEFVTGTSAVGFDPENASAVGRVVAVQVIKKW
ncbi:TonB-dependent receptor [Edaphosphingomonas haloaromaticamans]|uniref:TonB-dependent receptor n=1 Tax=Edaphosphingomonas haloaromaticamans TaxID=653954 RepID=UPI00174D708F|nr:TonB-dependent receptor [Sphingomonas haloaromaticamans]